jgi:hypothetical protein
VAPGSSLAEILPLSGSLRPAPARPRLQRPSDRPAGGTRRNLPEGQRRRWGRHLGARAGPRARLGPGPCQWRLPLTGAAAAPHCACSPVTVHVRAWAAPVVMAFLAAQIAIALLSAAYCFPSAQRGCWQHRAHSSFDCQTLCHFPPGVMTKVIITCPSLLATKPDYERYSSPVAFCPAAFRSFF